MPMPLLPMRWKSIEEGDCDTSLTSRMSAYSDDSHIAKKAAMIFFRCPQEFKLMNSGQENKHISLLLE